MHSPASFPLWKWGKIILWRKQNKQINFFFIPGQFLLARTDLQTGCHWPCLWGFVSEHGYLWSIHLNTLWFISIVPYYCASVFMAQTMANQAWHTFISYQQIYTEKKYNITDQSHAIEIWISDTRNMLALNSLRDERSLTHIHIHTVYYLWTPILHIMQILKSSNQLWPARKLTFSNHQK